MGKLKTRTGLSSLANSDVFGQLKIEGGGASIPFLVEGATNRLLEIKDASSGRVALYQDASGNELFEILTTGLTVGGSYTLPLTDGSADYVLTTNGSGTVTWNSQPSAPGLDDVLDVENEAFTNTLAVRDLRTKFSNDGGSTHTGLRLFRDSDSPADGDRGEAVDFSFNNSVDAELTTARLIPVLETAGSNTAAKGGLIIETYDAANFLVEGLRVKDGTIKVADAYTFPTSDGTANQVLQTDGSGNLSFGAGGSTTTPTLQEVVAQGNSSSNSISMTAAITSTMTGTTSNFQAVSSDGGSSDWWPFYSLRFSSTPSAADIVSSFPFFGMNDNSQIVAYSVIQSRIAVATDGSEDGILALNVVSGGANVDALQLKATGAEFYDEYTLPIVDGTSNQILRTNGSGAVSWGDQQQLGNTDQTIFNNRVVELDGNTFEFEEGGDPLLTFQEGEVSIGQGGSQGTGELRFMEETGNGTNFVGFRAPASIATDKCYVLPAADGSSGQFLKTDGAGNMSWDTAGSGNVSLEDAMAQSDIDGEGTTNQIVWKGPTGWQFQSADNVISPTLEDVISNGGTATSQPTFANILMTGSHTSIGNFTFLGTGDNTITGLLHANGGIEVDTDLTVKATALTAAQTIQVTNTSASHNVALELYRSNGTATDGDGLASIEFTGHDSIGDKLTYGCIKVEATDTTNNSEDGTVIIQAATAGGLGTNTLAIAQEGVTFHNQFQFPNVDGTANQILSTDGSGNVDWVTPSGGFVGKQWNFDRRGVHQLTTSTDTRYRFASSTTYPEYGNWNRSSTTIPSSLTRSAQYIKSGHMVTETLADCDIVLVVNNAILTSTSGTTSAGEYSGDSYSCHLYKWGSTGGAILIGTASGTFNASSSGNSLTSATFTGVSLTRGDTLHVVSQCATNASSTRYWAQNYSLHVEEQDGL